MLRPWRLLGTSRLQRCRVFDLDETRFSRPSGGDPATFYRITAPDWINVVPLTDAMTGTFERVLLYLCNLWQATGYAGGVDGPVPGGRVAGFGVGVDGDQNSHPLCMG